MKLENEFTVGVPIEQAWSVLTDLELIAPCMPGAQLTGFSDGVYTGKVKIKVGPVTAEYAGTAQFSEKDGAAYRAVIDARGRDSRGQGNATALISAQLRAAGPSTVVTVDTDLSIAGRIAQFGSGMIKEVSAKLLGQFVAGLEERLGGGTTASSPPAAAAADAVAADGAAPVGLTAAKVAGAAGSPDEPAGQGMAGGVAAADARAAEPAGTTTAMRDSPATGSADAKPAHSAAEPAPLDLMSLAGRAVYKRVLPLVAVAVLVVVVIIVLIVK